MENLMIPCRNDRAVLEDKESPEIRLRLSVKFVEVHFVWAGGLVVKMSGCDDDHFRKSCAKLDCRSELAEWQAEPFLRNLQ